LRQDVRATYARGEKCATVLLTEMEVGKETPSEEVGFTIRRGKRK
jgi:hypothetical protein